VIDALGGGFHALTTRSPAAYPLLALAGIASGIGPCAAPRALALTALVHGSRRPLRTGAAFVAGVLCAYAAIALAAHTLAPYAGSRVAYACAAIFFLLGGGWTLARAAHARCAAHAPDTVRVRSDGGALLLGASSALLASPCCTPALAAIAALGASGGGSAIGPVLAFACGHAFPSVVAACAATRCASLLRAALTAQAPAIVAGTLALALACYYAVLA
jgi:cytochrome c-type biogenesis protein